MGCPRFAAMSMREKINIVKKAKLCNFCLDSEFVVTRPNLPHQNCPVNLKKRPFTCVERNCRMHFWLCDKKDHIKLNSEKFEKAKFWWSRKGKVFANLANIYHYTKPSSKVQVESFNYEAVAEGSKDEVTCCIKEATKQLKEAVKGSTVFDVPEGEPLFLFSSAVGKNNPVKIFYDKGCSHVVFCEGVPDKELVGVMTKKGPLMINGVGDTNIKVNDEWACLLDRADGCKQVVQGVTVDRITSSFPMVSLKEAVREIKADDPRNQELQQLRVPDQVGGEADVLLGILYESCHPVHVHTLPSGLFLAKLKLASAGNKWTGVVGGPHRSFAALVQQAGDVSKLLVHFANGLRDFGSLGAPKLHGPVMTYEDVQLAQMFSKSEVEDFTGKEIVFYDEDLDDTAEVRTDLVENDDTAEVQGAVAMPMALQCGLCGVDVAEGLDTVLEEIGDVPIVDFVNGVRKKVLVADLFDEDDKLRELKMLVKMQELGISIEYRCPACRKCSDCKNAPATERISLREEAEDQAIKDSVTIDFERKKITVAREGRRVSLEQQRHCV